MVRIRSESPRGDRISIAMMAIACLAVALLPAAVAAAESDATLNRIRAGGKLTLGYRTDGRPFSYRDESGNAAGYAVEVCKRIAEQVKTDAGAPTLAVEWIPVTIEDRFRAVQDGKVDLLCAPDTATLSRRKDFGFSIPVFPGGVGAMLRSDASFRLRQVLSKGAPTGPFWRASPAQILEKQTFAVVKDSTAEQWLAGRSEQLQIDAKVVPVASYDAGVQAVLDRRANVFFADRAILLDAAKRSASGRNLVVLDRRFTYSPLVLTLARGDEDFRLLVDRALSRLFASDAFPSMYAKWFGEPGDYARNFFQMNAVPE